MNWTFLISTEWTALFYIDTDGQGEVYEKLNIHK